GRSRPRMLDLPWNGEPARKLWRTHAAWSPQLAPAAAGAKDDLHRPAERGAVQAFERQAGKPRDGPRSPAAPRRERQARALGVEPRAGRAPVSVSHEEFVAKFKTWMDAGAPCAVASR